MKMVPLFLKYDTRLTKRKTLNIFHAIPNKITQVKIHNINRYGQHVNPNYNVKFPWKSSFVTSNTISMYQLPHD